MADQDTWTRRAVIHREESFSQLTTLDTFQHPEKYRQAVSNLNRVLSRTPSAESTRISLSDFQHRSLSPVNSNDLIRAFETPEKNPFYGYFKKRLTSLLKEQQPTIIGLSLNFLSQALCAFALIGYIRQQMGSTVIVVMGGGLVTSWKRQINWRNPFAGIVDHLVAGPGEAFLLSLAEPTIKNEESLPVYHIINESPYLSPGVVLPYSASRGCYWRKCAFCPENTEAVAYRPTSPSLVVSQLQTLARRYQPKLIHLTDNALSPALMKALMERPPGPNWYGFARFTKHLTHRDYCVALRQSGCVMLQIGLESGSQTVLDAFGKGIDLHMAEKALFNLRQVGIATYVYLLFGTPWESERDAEMTYAFAIRHAENISFLNLAVFNLPASAATTDTLATSLFYTGDLSIYKDFTHPKGWQRHNVRKFLDKKFRRHPALAKIIRKDPPTFTSNHAPFFSP